MFEYNIPYGKGEMVFNLPYKATVAHVPEIHDLPWLRATFPEVDFNRFQRAVIVFTDATRLSPDQWMAEWILKHLPFAPEDITFLCAVGMHRPSTEAEKRAKLGDAIVDTYRVIDHNPAEVVTIGEIDGIPVEVNPLLVEPGTMVICLGVVEPHQYAGFSGGAKTAVIGCGGARTIAATHGPAMLDRPGVRLMQLKGNPFQEFVQQAGALIGIDVVMNVFIVHHEVRDVKVGEAAAVIQSLAGWAASHLEALLIDAPYDVVIAGTGDRKDSNLYQASRAATYIGLAEAPVIRKGGTIIVPAKMPEGAGQGVGERAFYAALERFKPTPALLEHMRREGCQPGEQRAYMLAQLLADYRLIFVGADDPQMLERAGLESAPTIEEAVARIGLPEPKILIVPDAIHILPIDIRQKRKPSEN